MAMAATVMMGAKTAATKPWPATARHQPRRLARMERRMPAMARPRTSGRPWARRRRGSRSRRWPRGAGAAGTTVACALLGRGRVGAGTVPVFAAAVDLCAGLRRHHRAALAARRARRRADGRAVCAGVGLETAVTARKVLRRLSAGSDSGTVDGNRLVGSTAQVLIPAQAGGTGKIRLVARGTDGRPPGPVPDGAPLAEGAEVLILDLKDGIAEVTADLDDRPRALPEKSDTAKTDNATNPAALADRRAENNPPQKG